jgi:hypothetical protein
MYKNLTILILAIGMAGIASLYLLNPRIVTVKSDPIVLRDTVYQTDTIFVKAETEQAESRRPVAVKPNKPAEKKDTLNPYSDAVLTSRIIPSEGITFGYEILMNGRLYIRQPNIPGLPGNAGFKDRETADRVAKLVIDKIRRNEMPPSITPQELKKINALE